jgi:hypothetical protein
MLRGIWRKVFNVLKDVEEMKERDGFVTYESVKESFKKHGIEKATDHFEMVTISDGMIEGWKSLYLPTCTEDNGEQMYDCYDEVNYIIDPSTSRVVISYSYPETGHWFSSISDENVLAEVGIPSKIAKFLAEHYDVITEGP